MPSFAASAVVIKSGKVLLIQREDFEVWGLPGGGVDLGESVAQTATREVFEETGIEITLTRLIGIYSSPRWHNGGDHVIVFAAIPNNDTFKLSKNEVIDAGYFAPTELPEPLIWWHRQRILDGLDGQKGIVTLQDTIWPFESEMRRWESYRLRDESNLTRQEFYTKYFTQIGPEGEKVEVK